MRRRFGSIVAIRPALTRTNRARFGRPADCKDGAYRFGANPGRRNAVGHFGTGSSNHRTKRASLKDGTSPLATAFHHRGLLK